MSAGTDSIVDQMVPIPVSFSDQDLSYTSVETKSSATSSKSCGSQEGRAQCLLEDINKLDRLQDSQSRSVDAAQHPILGPNETDCTITQLDAEMVCI